MPPLASPASVEKQDSTPDDFSSVWKSIGNFFGGGPVESPPRAEMEPSRSHELELERRREIVEKLEHENRSLRVELTKARSDMMECMQAVDRDTSSRLASPMDVGRHQQVAAELGRLRGKLESIHKSRTENPGGGTSSATLSNGLVVFSTEQGHTGGKEFEQRVQQLEARAAQLDQYCQQMEASLQAAEGEKEHLTNELLRARQSAGQIPGQMESLNMQLNQATLEKEELARAYASLQDQYRDHPEVNALRQQCEVLEWQASQAKQLSADLKELQSHHQTMQTQQAEFYKMQELCQTLEAEAQSAGRLQAEVVKLQEWCHTLEAENQSARALKSQYDALQVHCERLQTEYDSARSLQAQHRGLQQELEAMQASHSNLSGLADEYKALKFRNEELQVEVSRLQEHCDRVESQLATSGNHELDVQTLREQVRALEGECVGLRVVETEVVHLRAQCQGLEEELNRMQNVAQEAETLREQNGLLASQGERHDSLVGEVNRLRMHVHRVETEKQSVELKHAQLSEQYDGMHQSASQLKEELEGLQASSAQGNSQSQEISRLEHKCQQLEGQLLEHKVQLGRLQGEYQSLQEGSASSETLKAENERLITLCRSLERAAQRDVIHSSIQMPGSSRSVLSGSTRTVSVMPQQGVTPMTSSGGSMSFMQQPGTRVNVPTSRTTMSYPSPKMAEVIQVRNIGGPQPSMNTVPQMSQPWPQSVTFQG